MSALFRRGGWVFIVALALAVVDWVATARRDRRLEYIFKPATLCVILVGAWILTSGPHHARLAQFFLCALFFSLVGDVFLLLPAERFFLPGLFAFLFAHICYIVGLNPALPPLPAFGVLLPIAAFGLWYYRQIAAALRREGRSNMLLPTAAYAVILALMLFSGWATLFRPGWPWAGRAAVLVGTSLFFASDALLSWDRFVRSSRPLHVSIIVTYHLAQIALALSIALSA